MGNPCRVGVTRETEPQLEPPVELQGRDEDITIVPDRPNPPSLTGSARRMAELVVLSIQLGHPPSWTGSARQMAELVVWSIQLGHPPSWTVCSVYPSLRRAKLMLRDAD
ncbi:hypothetical protein F2Q68_00025108 [Brassica cretica]|uniref:Uncharacterized protein n=1 Tax=Brassica cretica TaxID=69181 RepID=A0A8S9IBF7_BRACR|nr:hypothetical protein F2Q68_00025108 [Brassica cretica]